jgi:hypothetical protein
VNIQYNETLNAAAYKLPRIKRGYVGDNLTSIAVPAAAYSNPDKSGLVPYTPPATASTILGSNGEKRLSGGGAMAESFGLDPVDIVLTDPSTPRNNNNNSTGNVKA